MLRKALAFAIVIVSLSFNAQAATFDYSYTFNEGAGGVVSGSFDGTASGNLVTGLSNITAAINGNAFCCSGSLFGSSFDPYSRDGLGGFVSGGAVASFDGLENNFFFSDTDFVTEQQRGFSNFYASFTPYHSLPWAVIRPSSLPSFPTIPLFKFMKITTHQAIGL